MKAILIKGIGMPEGENTFIDIRVHSDGSVLIPCGCDQGDGCKAEETEVNE